MQKIPNFIDGKHTPPASGKWLDNVEPATGKVYSQVADSDERDVDAAVLAAIRAFPAWSHTPAQERGRILNRIADRIEDNLDDLSRAETIDNGKPLSRCRQIEIPRAAANFRFFAGAILHESSELHATDYAALNYTLRRPRGVAGLISPWNLPLYLLTWKIAPALATGNTAVAKPSEVTPMTAHLLTELCVEAGLPAGVLNIVHGTGPTAGARLVAHPQVPTISFTGSTRAGGQIAGVAGPMFKKVSLEMGGKNPNLVFADADLDLAVPTSVAAAFSNQGQICLCGSRVFVEQAIYDEFLERFTAQTLRMKIGDPLEDGVDLGAMVSAAQLEKTERAVALAREEGGRVVVGGKRPAAISPRCAEGYYYEPTIITGLSPHCRTNQEEIFGPVVTIAPFQDEAEALAAANATSYGLSATVFTRDLDRAHRVAEQLAAGTVWINSWLLRDLRVPFGGVKQSGVGREGGQEALRFFTEPKNVCVKLS